MPQKDKTLKPRLPRGLADRSAAEIRATDRMLATIKRVYERYGFEPVETPLIEYTDVLGKFLPDQDRPNEGVFSFQDDDPQEARSGTRGEERSDRDQENRATGKTTEWMSLRYDLTAPLARYVAENYDRLPKPYRSYRSGWVFRNEKPGPGRFRQFMQFDADTVGSSSPAADAEMCMMAADTMEELGIPRGQYVIKVNSRKVLDEVMESAGATGDRQKLAVLRAIDKLDRLGAKGVELLLGHGRKDESGDFTTGAGLPESGVRKVLEFLVAQKMGLEAAPELAEIEGLARSVGYGVDRIRIDSSVVRGLEYYTGPVFEAALLFEIPNEKGQPVVFGSVGGGGRYDGLIGRFRGEDVPATGFSIGVSRLQAALAALGKTDATDQSGPVVVLVMDRDRVGDYQKMVADLRRADIAAELYLGDGRVGAQMKYADRRNAPLAIIQGGDEKAKGVVQIKDLVAGKKASAKIADNVEWREQRAGQEEVAEADLVEAVNRLLGRGERRP